MATITRKPWMKRRASYARRFVVDTVRGTIRVRKWPRKRGTPTSEAQLFWIDWFKQANFLAKYADEMSQRRAIEMSEKWPKYPRDVLLQAMRGKLYWWTDQTGWRWYPMSAIQTISDTLDVLAQTIGDVLVRAPDRWRSPGTGAAGEVLTAKGPGLAPTWDPIVHPVPAFGGAICVMLVSQSIPNATFTNMFWGGEQYDTDDIHDNTANQDRLTVPVGWTRIRVYAGVRWDTNSVGLRLLFFTKNGIGFPGSPQFVTSAISNSQTAIASAPLEVVAGDIFRAVVLQTSGAALNVTGPNDATWAGMERVS